MRKADSFPNSEVKLNFTTIKAIEDVKAGKTCKAYSVDELISECLRK